MGKTKDERCHEYLRGLMGKAKNKSVETMMLHEHGDDKNEIRAMQHFISEGAWDDQKVLARHAEEVSKDLGESEGVLIIDGSDFAKQGTDSAGVQRQWCGELGPWLAKDGELPGGSVFGLYRL